MGGDLQPFFAQRNIDPGASMQRNKFVNPAPETRGDHELAIAIARLENQEGPIADPARRPPPLRITGGQPVQRSSGYGEQQQYQQQQQAQPQQSRQSNGRHPHAAPPLPYTGRPQHEAAPPLFPPHHGRSMQGGGTPVAFQEQQHAELWRTGSGGHYDMQLQRQMSGLKSVAHTPRVNSTQAAPETLEMARKRLEMRLKKYNLCERKIKGDGNCQFRAVADQLYRDAKYHEDVRRIAVHHLRTNPSTYAQFVPTDFWQYCWEMEQLGTWGDHVTLQAIADAFGLRLNVLTSYPDSAFIAIKPAVVKSDRCLYLSFWAEIHYQSLFPKSDPPKSTKLLGSKTLHRLFS